MKQKQSFSHKTVAPSLNFRHSKAYWKDTNYRDIRAWTFISHAWDQTLQSFDNEIPWMLFHSAWEALHLNSFPGALHMHVRVSRTLSGNLIKRTNVLSPGSFDPLVREVFQVNKNNEDFHYKRFTEAVGPSCHQCDFCGVVFAFFQAKTVNWLNNF